MFSIDLSVDLVKAQKCGPEDRLRTNEANNWVTFHSPLSAASPEA